MFGYSMGYQMSAEYVAEKDGNLALLLDTFTAQRKYIDAYCSAIEAFGGDDNVESLHWYIHSDLAGEELAHFYPFRSRLLRTVSLAGLENADDFGRAYDAWPMMGTMRTTMGATTDGLVGDDSAGQSMI